MECKIILGAWEDKTYAEIHPDNPDYVERTVGYRLWQKLRRITGVHFTKKRVRIAVRQLQERRRKICVSYSASQQSSDQRLAEQFRHALQRRGQDVHMIDLDTALLSPLQPTLTALQHCHGFMVLLSPVTATGEMVLELLSRLRDCREAAPAMVAVLSDCQPHIISHDLQHYLTGALLWVRQPEIPPQAVAQALLHHLEQERFEPSSVALELKTVPPPDRQSLRTGPVEAEAAALPPVPTAEPEFLQGQVLLSSRLYVERPHCETRCYKAIEQSGALIRLKAPRQMGKTSLMARILHRAEQLGYRAVPLSFQHADRATFQDLGSLLRWFCARVAQRLQLPLRLEDYWGDMFGSKDNCTIYFQEYLLESIESPLVLCLDEVDVVFQYSAVADDFFGLLRAWYEDANYGYGGSRLWEKLRLVVVHSTEVYLPLDINQSPFNVGLPVELPEFTAAQVQGLAQRVGLNWQQEDIAQLMELVGGHPYLVQLALYHARHYPIDLEQLRGSAATEAGIYGDHLRRHLLFFEQHPDLAQAYRQVLRSQHPVSLDSKLMFKLHSLGLVHLQDNGALVSFELYRQYFSRRLGTDGEVGHG